jgi:hypothetical protein
LNEVTTNLNSLESKIENNKSQLKSSEEKDVQKVVELYSQYFDESKEVNKTLIVSLNSLSCTVKSYSEIQAEMIKAEAEFKKVENTQDIEILSKSLLEVASLFKTTSDKLNKQADCFSDPKIKEIYTASQLETGKVTTAKALKDLSDMYIGLADAIKKNDEAAANNITTSIETISNSPSITNIADQDEQINKLLLENIKTTTDKRKETRAKIDVEINQIASKYGLVEQK